MLLESFELSAQFLSLMFLNKCGLYVRFRGGNSCLQEYYFCSALFQSVFVFKVASYDHYFSPFLWKRGILLIFQIGLLIGSNYFVGAHFQKEFRNEELIKR